MEGKYRTAIVDVRCGVQDLLYAGSDCEVSGSKSIEQPSCTVLRNEVNWPHYYSYISTWKQAENRIQNSCTSL